MSKRIAQDPPEVLTSAGAAKLLGVHINTLYRLLELGQLPGKKVGRVWRFRRDLLLDYLNDRRI